MRRYSLNSEIDMLKERLIAIADLRHTVKTKGWIEVIKVFNELINRYYQEIFEKCENPSKHEIEIRCKRMVAEALGSILKTLDERVASEEFVKKTVLDKMRKNQELEDNKALRTI